MKKIFSLTLTLIMLASLIPAAGTSVSAAEFDLSISGTEALYSSFDYSDPMHITDEAFFGKWDGTKWINEPYFDYELYPALADAKEAAKSGDYKSAREEITEYYREKFRNQPRAIKTSGDTSSIIAAKLAAYNTLGASGFTNLDIIGFSSKQSTVQADVLSLVQSAAKDSSLKTRTFQIAAAYNDGATACVHSRESAYSPYITATVNGANRVFYPTADTYIRGGSYQDTNFGTSITNPDNILKIAEADVFPNTIKPPYTRGDYSGVNRSGTMRARMTFDFSSLSPGDVVSSAKLCLTGYSDSSSQKLCVVQYKSDIGGSETDSTWTWRGTIRSYLNYTGQPGGFGYSGDNSTKLDRSTLINYDAVSLLYSVYRHTMDEAYAYHAFRFLLAHIKGYGHTPNIGSNGTSNLALATRSADLPVALAQLSTSKYFTADNFVPILKYVWMCGDMLVKCWNSQSEQSNWGLYETAGLAALQINFKEFNVVDDPIADGGYGEGKQGGWWEVVNHRYYLLSKNLIREDKSFDETLGYGRECVYNFLKYETYASEAGEEVKLSDALKENLNNFGHYIMNASGPSFRDFQYGDCYFQSYSFRITLRDIAKATKDPLLLWAGSSDKNGTAPDYTSVLYPINRKASLKTGWKNDDMYIDFSSDQSIMTHNHPDDLNIIMYAYGQYLLTDQRQYNYGTNDPKRLSVYATHAHNTLALKNISHMANISGIYSGPNPIYSQFKPSNEWDMMYHNRARNGEPGTIHRSELNDAYDYIEMSHSNYENYVHPSNNKLMANFNCKRSLLFLKNARYVIVTDYVKALDDNEYPLTQNWHMLPEAKISMDSETGIARSNFPGANIQVIPVFAKSDMKAYIDPEGYYSPSNNVIVNAPYAVYQKDGAGDKVYNTILLPTKEGANIVSSSENLELDVPETDATASRITMTDADTKKTREVNYYFLHKPEKAAQRTFGNYSTDGKMALSEKYADSQSMLILQGGTNITDEKSGRILLKTLDKTEELSVTFEEDKVMLDSSKEIDPEKLTFRAEKKVNTVTLNGKEIPFTQELNYIYFGDEPLLDEESKIRFETYEGKSASASLSFVEAENLSYKLALNIESKDTTDLDLTAILTRSDNSILSNSFTFKKVTENLYTAVFNYNLPDKKMPLTVKFRLKDSKGNISDVQILQILSKETDIKRGYAISAAKTSASFKFDLYGDDSSLTTYQLGSTVEINGSYVSSSNITADMLSEVYCEFELGDDGLVKRLICKKPDFKNSLCKVFKNLSSDNGADRIYITQDNHGAKCAVLSLFESGKLNKVILRELTPGINLVSGNFSASCAKLMLWADESTIKPIYAPIDFNI